MGNGLATVPRIAQHIVEATLRTIFGQPDQASAHETIDHIYRLVEKRCPQVVSVL